MKSNMHNFSYNLLIRCLLSVRNEKQTKHVTEKHIPKSFAKNNERTMAKMVSCACGWTLISPQGDEDVKKHTMIHVKDAHPGMTMTQDDLTKMIKSV